MEFNFDGYSPCTERWGISRYIERENIEINVDEVFAVIAFKFDWDDLEEDVKDLKRLNPSCPYTFRITKRAIWIIK